MTSIFAATLRQATSLLRPGVLTRQTLSVHRAMTGLMFRSAFPPFLAPKPKKARQDKVAGRNSGRSLCIVQKELRAADTKCPGAASRASTPHVPKNAQYLSRTFRSASGSIDYTIYLPASQPQRLKGLILMLHGCNQSPDDFALGTNMNFHAEKHGFGVVYPAQTNAENEASCWNWFRPGDQSRGGGEPALLASLAKTLMQEFNQSRENMFVAGLSAGGAMAVILGTAYPDVFSAVGVHSGLARGSASGALSAISAMRSGGSPSGAPPDFSSQASPARWIVFHGDEDSTVHPSNALAIVAGAMGDNAVPTRATRRTVRERAYTRSDFVGPEGLVGLELWILEGAGHKWSGGRETGSYTDRKGPDASAQMVRFFLANHVKT